RSNDVGDAYVGFVDFISGEARKIRRSEPAKTKRQKQRTAVTEKSSANRNFHVKGIYIKTSGEENGT
ncbi:hypothetical protein QIG84_28285, partial [Klebsiella pneumoniae]|nr:hypothetical protein [Klebsiella pneumoniae]